VSAIDLLPPGSWQAPLPDAAERVEAAERRLGHSLPRDLRELHLRCAGVSLCRERYVFLPVDRIAPIAELQVGDTTDDWAPRTWVAVVDLHDGDYVAVDLVPSADGSHSWLDCCHETIGEASVIATSLEEFLREALARPDGQYWLERGHRPYREIVYKNPPSFYRKIDGDRYRALGDEIGPERCTTPGCSRLHISLSVKCRRHHYEMMTGRPSPFDDD
jgi:cell wall assembly regulator SMI1